MIFLLIGMDSCCMLFHQSSEDEDLEHAEYQYGQQEIQRAAVGGIGREADAENVEARRAPHQACQKQQGVPLNFHGFPPYERCSICRIKNSHGLWEF